MKKVIFMICIVFLSVLSYTQDTSGVHYFPLKQGNCWRYLSYSSVPPGTTSSFMITVLRDTIIEGRRCFILNQSLPIVNQYVVPSSVLYLDSSNGNLFTYTSWSCNSPFIILDSLSSSLNDTFHQCPSHPYGDKRLCYETGIRNFAGNNYLYKRFNKVNHTFQYISEYLYNIGYSYGYSNDLYPNWYRTYTLLGCVINGIVYGDTTSPVGVQNIWNEIPDKSSLSQNYPNPFNPVTKIKFSLPVPSIGGAWYNVSLVIYDILGREVETLIPPLGGGHEGLNPGSYEVQWDGSRYASGVYFYKLMTDEWTETKKMVLIK